MKALQIVEKEQGPDIEPGPFTPISTPTQLSGYGILRIGGHAIHVGQSPNDRNRAVFLNELDGFRDNEGLLVLASSTTPSA